MVEFLAVTAVAGVFPGKHLGACTGIVVVAVGLLFIEAFPAVVVLVYKVYVQFTHLLPEVVEPFPAGIGAGSANYLDFRVFLTHGLHEGDKAFNEFLSPLLVADSKVFEAERCGMAHLGTHLSPFAFGGTVGELYEVQGVLDIALKVFQGAVWMPLWVILELAGHATAYNGDGLCANFFGKAEVLKETEAAALVVVREHALEGAVVPAVDVYGTVFNGAHGVFPLVAVLKVGAFHDAAAGETEDAGVEVCEGLRQILPEAVFIPVKHICGEKGDVLNVHGGFRVFVPEEKAEGAFLKRFRRSDGSLILCPLAALNGDFGKGKVLVFHLAAGIHKDGGKAGFLRLSGRAGPKGELVACTLFIAYPKPAFVLEAALHGGVGGCFQAYVVGVALKGGTFSKDFHFAEGFPVLEGIVVLEGTVGNLFGIQAAVGRKVYVFQKNSVHGGLDGDARGVSVHHKVVSAGLGKGRDA